MNAEALRAELLEFTKSTYPDIDILVEDGIEVERRISFMSKRFADLYPQQRYHYLIHLIPNEFYENHLQNTVWFELAPGENPDELDYLDEETVESIKDTIINILEQRTSFVSQLDDMFLTNAVTCNGDFRYAKQILTELKFNSEEQFDIFHVMMNEGGFCDCEILYNVFKQSNYAKNYWKNRIS